MARVAIATTAQAAAAIKAIEDAFAASAKAAETAVETTTTGMNAIAEAGAAALKAIDTEMQSIQQSLASEAPEEVMGVIETEMRAKLAALEAEKALALVSIAEQTSAKQLAADAAQKSADQSYTHAANQARALDDDLRSLFSRGYNIPITYSSSGGPAWGGAMAEGGAGTVSGPTMFMAGEAGPESFWFSGANKGGSAPGVSSSGPATGEDQKLQRELAGLRSDMAGFMRDQPRAIAMAVRDSLVKGGR